MKDIGIILPYVWRVFVPCVHRWFLVMTIWKMGLGRIILHPDMITVRARALDCVEWRKRIGCAGGQ